MAKAALLTLTLTAVLAGSLAASEIYVPDSHATIQGAIDSASAGDTVVVRPGTYVENIDFKGKAITVRSEMGPVLTVIDGGSPANPDFGSVVLFANGEGSDSVISGFTLTNGTGTFAPSFFSHTCGGAVFCEETSPTITGNVLRGNWAEYGGAVCCSRTPAAPFVTENLIENNSAQNAGAVFCRYSSTEVVSNVIRSNTASFGGGAISCWMDGSPHIASNLFDGNSCGGGGGGAIRAYNTTTPVIVNNTFVGNEAVGGEGGGVMCQNCDVTVDNSIFWNNSAAVGPEIWVGHTSRPASLTISHSNVRGGQTSVHVDSGSTLNWSGGMIDADPLFADIDDYHLTLQSPCIDGGDDTVSGLPAVDFEGDPRSATSAADIGADEFSTHLYALGKAIPGQKLIVRVAGQAGLPVLLALGSGIESTPFSTAMGDLFLSFPLLGKWAIGTIPAEGILTLNPTTPTIWTPGDIRPFQALAGPWGGPDSSLSNLLILHVE